MLLLNEQQYKLFSQIQTSQIEDQPNRDVPPLVSVLLSGLAIGNQNTNATLFLLANPLASVTRLGPFWKGLQLNLLTKVAQIPGDIWDYLPKCIIMFAIKISYICY